MRRAREVSAGLGLVNSGNTCYANAILQCLSTVTHVLSRLRDESAHVSSIHPGRDALDALLCDCCVELHCRRHDRDAIQHNPLNPLPLLARVRTLENGLFRAGEQHDAAEFLRALVQNSVLDQFFSLDIVRALRRCAACGSVEEDHHGMTQHSRDAVLSAAASAATSAQGLDIKAVKSYIMKYAMKGQPACCGG